ncbi:MAG: toluene hydroxylase [Gammaproteobacteria bacterium]
MTPQRTYWHLQPLGRKPTEYEIASSRLFWHPQRGFETRVPVADWYLRYQRRSPLQCDDWERFADPRATTYASYVALQNDRETFVDGLLRAHLSSSADARLSPDALALLARVLAPMRYPAHALQMAAAYVAQMAPSGRITLAAMFQAADEMRRVQRLAYRLRLLQTAHPLLADDSRERWERDAAWQPLRETLERLLVAWDWGEAFVALNLVVKPAFDTLTLQHFGAAARMAGDELVPQLFFSLAEDAAWQRDWSVALAQVALAACPENHEALQTWRARWQPRASAFAETLAEAFCAPQAKAAIVDSVERHGVQLWHEVLQPTLA